MKRIRIYHPPKILLSYMDTLCLRSLGINKRRKKSSRSFLYLIRSRNLWEMKNAIISLSLGKFYCHEKKWKVSTNMGLHKLTLLNNHYLPLVFPHIFAFLTLEAQNSLFSWHFSTNGLSFVKKWIINLQIWCLFVVFISLLWCLTYAYEITIFLLLICLLSVLFAGP